MASTSCSSPPPVGVPSPDCTSVGGCDVLVDRADGSSTIIPLKTSSIADATSRAITEVQKDGVLDTAVVGDKPPHVALSNLFHH